MAKVGREYEAQVYPDGSYQVSYIQGERRSVRIVGSAITPKEAERVARLWIDEDRAYMDDQRLQQSLVKTFTVPA